jgi:alpha-tubulin suppressor-like RCC1 family protein
VRNPSPGRCIDVPEVMNVTVQVAFGISSTTFLDVNGTVWTVGAPIHGQLGRGYLLQEEQENVPGVVKLPEPIKSIAMGANHVLALGVSGVLYGWGANALGQLGQGSTEPTYVSPQVINFVRYENVSCISAGAQHSAVVTLGGRFYVFGSNAQGQMGRNPDAGNGGVTNLTKPTEIPRTVFKGDNLVALHCGEMHTSVATDTAVYTFGGDIWGQLGRDFRYNYALRATSAASSLALSTEEATQSQMISNWRPNTRPMDLYARFPPVVPPFPFNNSVNDTFTPTYAPYQIVTAPPYPSVRRGRDCT